MPSALTTKRNKYSRFSILFFLFLRNNQPARCYLNIGCPPSAAHRASLPACLSYTSPPWSKQFSTYPPRRGDPRVHCAEHPALSLQSLRQKKNTEKNISSPRKDFFFATYDTVVASGGRRHRYILVIKYVLQKRHQHGVARLCSSAPT